MAPRTVRLEQEAERALAQIVTATGRSTSAAMKRALLAPGDDVARKAARVPCDVYRSPSLAREA